MQIGASIFTSILFEGYQPPNFIDVENTFNYQGFARLIDQRYYSVMNIESRVHQLAKHLESMAAASMTSHILFPLGDDFSFINASNNFIVMDLFMEGLKKEYPTYNIFYSSLGRYVKETQAEAQDKLLTWPKYYRDFFPLIDHKHVWSGYYTSRPYFKRFVNFLEEYSQTSSQL
jgi:hypothetical protein